MFADPRRRVTAFVLLLAALAAILIPSLKQDSYADGAADEAKRAADLALGASMVKPNTIAVLGLYAEGYTGFTGMPGFTVINMPPGTVWNETVNEGFAAEIARLKLPVLIWAPVNANTVFPVDPKTGERTVKMLVFELAQLRGAGYPVPEGDFPKDTVLEHPDARGRYAEIIRGTPGLAKQLARNPMLWLLATRAGLTVAELTGMLDPETAAKAGQIASCGDALYGLRSGYGDMVAGIASKASFAGLAVSLGAEVLKNCTGLELDDSAKLWINAAECLGGGVGAATPLTAVVAILNCFRLSHELGLDEFILRNLQYLELLLRDSPNFRGLIGQGLPPGFLPSLLGRPTGLGQLNGNVTVNYRTYLADGTTLDGEIQLTKADVLRMLAGYKVNGGSAGYILKYPGGQLRLNELNPFTVKFFLWCTMNVCYFDSKGRLVGPSPAQIEAWDGGPYADYLRQLGQLPARSPLPAPPVTPPVVTLPTGPLPNVQGSNFGVTPVGSVTSSATCSGGGSTWNCNGPAPITSGSGRTVVAGTTDTGLPVNVELINGIISRISVNGQGVTGPISLATSQGRATIDTDRGIAQTLRLNVVDNSGRTVESHLVYRTSLGMYVQPTVDAQGNRFERVIQVDPNGTVTVVGNTWTSADGSETAGMFAGVSWYATKGSITYRYADGRVEQCFTAGTATSSGGTPPDLGPGFRLCRDPNNPQRGIYVRGLDDGMDPRWAQFRAEYSGRSSYDAWSSAGGPGTTEMRQFVVGSYGPDLTQMRVTCGRGFMSLSDAMSDNFQRCRRDSILAGAGVHEPADIAVFDVPTNSSSLRSEGHVSVWGSGLTDGAETRGETDPILCENVLDGRSVKFLRTDTLASYDACVTYTGPSQINALLVGVPPGRYHVLVRDTTGSVRRHSDVVTVASAADGVASFAGASGNASARFNSTPAGDSTPAGEATLAGDSTTSGTPTSPTPTRTGSIVGGRKTTTTRSGARIPGAPATKPQPVTTQAPTTTEAPSTTMATAPRNVFGQSTCVSTVRVGGMTIRNPRCGGR